MCVKWHESYNPTVGRLSLFRPNKGDYMLLSYPLMLHVTCV